MRPWTPAILLLGACCDDAADFARSVPEPGVHGIIRLVSACSDECGTQSAEGRARLFDGAGDVVAETVLDPETGSFGLEAPSGDYSLEIAVLGTAIEKNVPITLTSSSGFQIRRTYDEQHVSYELMVLFADGVTEEEQVNLLSAEPGVELAMRVNDTMILVVVDDHPQLVGESLDMRHDSIVGFELSFIGCPAGGG